MKAEALADSLEAQFQPVNDPLDPTVIKMVDVTKYVLLFTCSRAEFSQPIEGLEAIRGAKVGKAPGPDGIPNRALKHLSHDLILLLIAPFNVILRTRHFPPI